jgi:hypothetical protein
MAFIIRNTYGSEPLIASPTGDDGTPDVPFRK